jgi:ABC-type spermidine/putrescine transport system permease subunit II
MKRGPSWFNLISLTVGFAFLYLPTVLSVVWSFNASRLVTVWGAFRPNGSWPCSTTSRGSTRPR